eukprot:5534045-Amphidinium_carterae.1
MEVETKATGVATTQPKAAKPDNSTASGWKLSKDGIVPASGQADSQQAATASEAVPKKEQEPEKPSSPPEVAEQPKEM